MKSLRRLLTQVDETSETARKKTQIESEMRNEIRKKIEAEAEEDARACLKRRVDMFRPPDGSTVEERQKFKRFRREASTEIINIENKIGRASGRESVYKYV